MHHLRQRAGALGFAALAAAASFGTYRASLRQPLSSDAQFLTYRNAYVREPGGLARVWTADYFEGAVTNGVVYRSGYYRPVTNALFWIEYRVAGTATAAYHVSQIALHALMAFLVFLLVRRLAPDPRIAWIAGLLFAVHPVHAFAATDPAARADVLFAVFYVGALLAFDGALHAASVAARRWHAVLSALLALLSVLSKEMGITAPAALVLLALYRHRAHGSPLGALRLTLPAWLGSAAYLVWRFAVLGLARPEAGYASEHGPLILGLAAVKALTVHLSRLVLPLGPTYPELNPRLVAFVDRPIADPVTWTALAVLLGLVTLTIGWRRRPWLALAAAFTLVSYAPLFLVDNIMGALGTNVVLSQERWFYLPALPALTVIAVGAVRLWDRLPSARARVLGAVAAAGVVLALARTATRHAGRHLDPFAQLRQLYLYPEERLSRLERANKRLLYAQWVAVPLRQYADAEARTRDAVRMVPDSPIPAAALAEVLARQGKWPDVVALLSPWLTPSREMLERHHRTNRRVGDDLNRVNGTIVLLLARANGHLGRADASSQLLCEASRRMVAADALNAARRELLRLGIVEVAGCTPEHAADQPRRHLPPPEATTAM